MPIYEFRCQDCNFLVELFFIKSKEKIEIKCSNCGSKNLERVLSITNLSVNNSTVKSHNDNSSKEVRNCSTGSCATYNIPGEV